MLAIKTILCPTDFSEPSYEGLKYGIELAILFSADLSLTNIVPAVPPLPIDPTFVFPIPEYERELRADSERKLRELIEQRVPKNLKVRTVIGYGDAGNEIVRIAEDERADLIVMATTGLTGLRHILFGSVAEKVVRLAACPVLTVRGPVARA
ncbi:MAG TPA: universal stress protein [Blastocatellia bacterium]|nr:universal stress protein [Blastocatellia bacterium]